MTEVSLQNILIIISNVCSRRFLLPPLKEIRRLLCSMTCMTYALDALTTLNYLACLVL